MYDKMKADDFRKCLKVIRREEGGNDDDPRDPGGRTSRGIIQREWDVFRRTHPGRPADVWRASDADIDTIYFNIPYWKPYAILMASGVNLCFFNAAVNSGQRQAVKELQRCLEVTADGWIGNITLGALATRTRTKTGSRSLIDEMCERRRIFYRSLSLCPVYCRGWLARTDRVERDANYILDGKLLARKKEPIEELGKAKAYPSLALGGAKAYPEGD